MQFIPKWLQIQLFAVLPHPSQHPLKCHLLYHRNRYCEDRCALSTGRVSLPLLLETLFTYPKSLTIRTKMQESVWVKATGLDSQLKSLHLINLSSSILHSKGTYDLKEIANQMITHDRKLDKRERNHFNTIKRFCSAIILMAKNTF